MGFTLPPGTTLNLRKWAVRVRLYPPHFFAPGIQNDLLAWLNACGKASDGVEFSWTANIGGRHLGKLDGRFEIALSETATT
jgi:hypothetical protein